MKTIILILIFLISIIQVQAFEIPSFCQNNNTTGCDCGKVPSIKNPKWMEPFADINFFDGEIQKIYKANERVKHDLLDLFRTMRDGKSEPTYAASTKELDEIKKDFDVLTQLAIESQRSEMRFNICVNNCSASKRLEIEDDMKRIQKIKMALLIKRPLLASEKFEKLFKSMSEKQVMDGFTFDRKAFDETMKDTLFDNLQKIDARSSEYQAYLNDGKKPLERENNVKYAQEYRDNLVNRFPNLMDTFFDTQAVNADNLNSSEKKFICRNAESYKSHLKKEKIKEVALDASLLILPLLTGPLSPAIESGMMAGLGGRLLAFGIKEGQIASMIRTSGSVVNYLALGKDAYDTHALSKECNGIQVKLLNNPSESTYANLKSCQNELSNSMMTLGIGAALTGVTSISSDTLKILKEFSTKIAPKAIPIETRVVNNSQDITKYLYQNGFKETKSGAMGVEFSVPGEGTFTAMDLSKLNNVKDPALKKVPEDYFKFVGGIYRERLNLTPQEIDGFIKSSMEASNRTKLILNTEKSTLNGEVKFRGGVGIVESRATSEPLPLEKATGIKLDRKPGEKIVEIVRLTASKDVEAEKTSKALVTQVMGLITQDKEVSRVFIFTSKIHSRLYRKMGIPMDKIKTISDRDVVIEITREEADQILKSKLLDLNAMYFIPIYTKYSAV